MVNFLMFCWGLRPWIQMHVILAWGTLTLRLVSIPVGVKSDIKMVRFQGARMLFHKRIETTPPKIQFETRSPLRFETNPLKLGIPMMTRKWNSGAPRPEREHDDLPEKGRLPTGSGICNVCRGLRGAIVNWVWILWSSYVPFPAKSLEIMFRLWKGQAKNMK